MKKFDALVAREYTDKTGQKKTSWKNIGSAYENDKNGMITVYLEAAPLSDATGQAKIVLKVPEPKTQNAPAQQPAQFVDDEIPF